MKFVALVYYDESKMGQMTQAEWDGLNRECMECGEDLRARGLMVGGEALHSVQEAKTLRIRGQKLEIMDGPFAETKEQLAGFYLLEARDVNEAIQAAQNIPPARYGSVEIREVRGLRAEENKAYEQ